MKTMTYQRKNNDTTIFEMPSDTQSEIINSYSFGDYAKVGLALVGTVAGATVLANKTGYLSSSSRGNDAASGNLLDNNPHQLVSSQDVITFTDNSLPIQPRHAKRAFGNEFQINTYTTNQQKYPSVASLTTEDFVVVWESYGQDGNYTGIYGQRYSSTGVPQGSEFQVNTYTTGSQYAPSRRVVASLSTGDFVVVWKSEGQDGDEYGIYGQRFSNTGIPQGGEFQINTYTTATQRYPSIAGLSAGDFVVVWSSEGQDGSGYGVYGQRYSGTGIPQGAEFQINTYTIGTQWYTSIATLSTGDFVVVWESGQDGDDYGIYGQRFSNTGAPQDAEFQINTYTTAKQWDPSVAALSTGGFVVVWSSNWQDGDGYGIYGQRFSNTGTPQDAEFQINVYTTNSQEYPSVAGINTGGFVVTWESAQDGFSDGIYGQRFSNTGVPQGSEFQINTYTANDQDRSAIAALSMGGFVVVWESLGQDGSSDGIFGRIHFKPVEINNNGLTVLSVRELFNINIGATNTTALSFDAIEITQIDPSLTINWDDTKATVYTVTIPDITSGRKVEITSDGTNANPTIITKTCKDGVCSEEKTTTLATAFSLSNANGEQIPTWLMWVVGSITGGVIIVASVGATACLCTYCQSEIVHNRHNARKKHDARAEDLKIKDEGNFHGPRFFQPPTSKGTTGVLSIDNQPEIQPAQALTP